MRRRIVQHRQHGGESGYTLVELAIAMALTGTLLAISLVVFSTFAHVESGTFSSYAELNQLTPVGTSFQRLLRTAVSPATGGVGAAPIPPFGKYTATGTLTPATPISATSLTFFANTGNPDGPVEVKATLTVTTPAAHPTTGTFVVQEIAPTATSCPGLGSPTARTRPATNRCTWPATGARTTVLKVYDVLVTTAKPVFAYHLSPPYNGTPPDPTAKPPTYGTPAGLTLSPFAKCTPTSCPADHIQSVTVDIEVHVAGAKNKVESQTVTYQLSTVSQTYSAAVG